MVATATNPQAPSLLAPGDTLDAFQKEDWLAQFDENGCTRAEQYNEELIDALDHEAWIMREELNEHDDYGVGDEEKYGFSMFDELEVAA